MEHSSVRLLFRAAVFPLLVTTYIWLTGGSLCIILAD